MPTTRAAIVTRITAGKTIAELIEATSTVLRAQMDKAARMLKAGNPNFYKEYIAARKIVHTRTTHTSVNGMFASKADGTPIYNAFVEIEGLGIVVYSDLEGCLIVAK